MSHEPCARVTLASVNPRNNLFSSVILGTVTLLNYISSKVSKDIISSLP